MIEEYHYILKVYDDRKVWMLDGKIHGEGFPAVIWKCGTKEWRNKGILHRLNGPAIEYFYGEKEYWLNGAMYSEEQYYEKLNPVKEMTVEEISKILGYEIKIIGEMK